MIHIDETIKGIFDLRATLEHVFFKDFIAGYEGADGLNQTHIMTIMMLNFTGTCPMATISERTNLEKGSFTPVANKLIKLGYINKEQNQEDKRVYNLSLTDKGKAFALEFKKNHIAYVKTKIDIFTNEEKDAYFKGIEIVGKMTMRLLKADDLIKECKCL